MQWPAQLCTMRDGAHGAAIAGISGRVGEGAFSVIIAGGNDASGQPYPNVDNGDEIHYCGTDSTNGIPSDGTNRLRESAENGKPVRVLRSHNLKNEYAPEIGFRYDGLYKIFGSEMMDPSDSKRQRFRFRMVRLPGQDPVVEVDRRSARRGRRSKRMTRTSSCVGVKLAEVMAGRGNGALTDRSDRVWIDTYSQALCMAWYRWLNVYWLVSSTTLCPSVLGANRFLALRGCHSIVVLARHLAQSAHS